MPVLLGRAPSKRRKASRPPAEAPTPTIGNESMVFNSSSIQRESRIRGLPLARADAGAGDPTEARLSSNAQRSGVGVALGGVACRSVVLVKSILNGAHAHAEYFRSF